jgi:hypothetical protein
VRALLSSVFFASCANTLTVTALGKFVFDLTHRELDLGHSAWSSSFRRSLSSS